MQAGPALGEASCWPLPLSPASCECDPRGPGRPRGVGTDRPSPVRLLLLPPPPRGARVVGGGSAARMAGCRWPGANPWARVPPARWLWEPNATHPVPARRAARGTSVLHHRVATTALAQAALQPRMHCAGSLVHTSSLGVRPLPPTSLLPLHRGPPPPVALPCVAWGPEARAQLARVCERSRCRGAESAVLAQCRWVWLAP